MGAKVSTKRSLKRDNAYETLLLNLIYGALRPGEPVDELRLAENYGLPRAGVREALARLEHEGLIARRPRLGSVVADLGVIELQQIFELRVQLEGRAAALAARNANEIDIARLKQAFEGVEEVIDRSDFRELIRMDLSFHRALAEATHNRWLAHVTNTLNTNALRFWYYSLSRRSCDTLRREIEAHLRVTDAISRGNEQEAQSAMRDVLGEFPSTVKGIFDESLSSSLLSSEAPSRD